MNNLQEIKSNQKNKYDEIIDYLKQDDGYWLENDKWDFTEEFFIGKKIYMSRYIDFSYIKNKFLKTEFKYFILYSVKNKLLKKETILNYSYRINPLGSFIEKYFYQVNSFNEITVKVFLDKWKIYLLNNICANQTLEAQWC